MIDKTLRHYFQNTLYDKAYRKSQSYPRQIPIPPLTIITVIIVIHGKGDGVQNDQRQNKIVENAAFDDADNATS